MKTANMVSVSGGKDSLATALLAVEREAENLTFVFADTGHEHAQTYEYLDYLDTVLPLKILRIRPDFSEDIQRKRHFIRARWGDSLYSAYCEKGMSHDQAAAATTAKIQEALAVLKPTGVPFLDLCLSKGMFPGTRRRFCTEHLKHHPIEREVTIPLLREYDTVVSWQGVRAQESASRAKLDEREESDPVGLVVYRPILSWSAEDVFAYIRKHGIKWNPLYEQGMSRVGCMPCIHAGKNEMHEIARRFPEALERVSEWERLVTAAAKTGAATFMDARVTARMLNTGTSVDDIHHETHGIMAYVEWARTSRGGKQFDLIKAVEVEEDVPMCSSVYGLCE